MEKNTKRKVISYSLFGKRGRYYDQPLYYQKCLKELLFRREVKGIFSDWYIHIYIDPRCLTKDIIFLQSQYKNIEFIIMKKKISSFCWECTFWRFLAISDPRVDVMISRDIDSELLFRDEVMVTQWLKSNLCFHTVTEYDLHRDHMEARINAGGWGCKSPHLYNMKELIKVYLSDTKNHYWGADEAFLKDVIFPLVKNKTLFHNKIALQNIPRAYYNKQERNVHFGARIQIPK